jgi:hypothetical protein
LSWLPSEGDHFHEIPLYTPDLADQLPEIFNKYIVEYDITVPNPEGVAWALKTPLAIRTFAEVYKGRTISAGQDLVTTLAELFGSFP